MFIGLDLGTSALKGILIEADQAVLAEASAALNVSRPHPGWSEQNPDDWLEAANTVMLSLKEQQDLGGVQAIGLSGQMHGATLLNEQGQVLRPCILWNDTRSAEEAAVMDAEPKWRAVSGNIVFPGFTAPKLVWVAGNEPEVFAATRMVLLPKDTLRLWMTGEAVSDMSDSAGTGWLDTSARDWSDALLAETGLSRAAMPRLVEGSEPSGQVRDELCDHWGLPRGVMVAGGGGDNAASAVGAGVVSAGQGFVSLGTSGVLFAASPSYQPAPETAVHTFCHALPGVWHQMGVILAATDALNWYAGATGKSAPELTDALGDLQPPGRTLFLPYIGGERTPHNDAGVRGALIGIEHATDTDAGTRAVLEGVAFAFRDSLDALTSTGTRLDRLIALGGGSQSGYWLKAIATALRLPVDVPVAGDYGGAFGAARLAMMAAGAPPGIATPPPILGTIEPDYAMADAFDAAHSRYRATYAALKDIS
ncbi:MAG: xylulokinase [Pseudomonadota bacterium]